MSIIHTKMTKTVTKTKSKTETVSKTTLLSRSRTYESGGGERTKCYKHQKNTKTMTKTVKKTMTNTEKKTTTKTVTKLNGIILNCIHGNMQILNAIPIFLWRCLLQYKFWYGNGQWLS